jgi:archaellum component FlaD/FlaE
MDEVQLQAIIAEAVKSAVEPLIARLDEIDSASKAEVPAVEVAEVIEEPVAEKVADVVEELAAEDEVAPVEEVVEKAEETPVVEEVVEEVVDEVVKAEDEAASVEEPVVEKAEEVVSPSEEEIAAEAKAVEEAAFKAAEEAAFKSELVDRLEKIEQRLGRVATGSKALSNDGGGAVVDEAALPYNRDAFGRRVK